MLISRPSYVVSIWVTHPLLPLRFLGGTTYWIALLTTLAKWFDTRWRSQLFSWRRLYYNLYFMTASILITDLLSPIKMPQNGNLFRRDVFTKQSRKILIPWLGSKFRIFYVFFFILLSQLLVKNLAKSKYDYFGISPQYVHSMSNINHVVRPNLEAWSLKGKSKIPIVNHIN